MDYIFDKILNYISILVVYYIQVYYILFYKCTYWYQISSNFSCSKANMYKVSFRAGTTDSHSVVGRSVLSAVDFCYRYRSFGILKKLPNTATDCMIGSQSVSVDCKSKRGTFLLTRFLPAMPTYANLSLLRSASTSGLGYSKLSVLRALESTKFNIFKCIVSSVIIDILKNFLRIT